MIVAPRRTRARVALGAALGLGLAGLTACPGGNTGKQPDNTVKVSLADVGLDQASLDTTADPCDDFYQYACGGWMASNEIPADRARWSGFDAIHDRNEAVLHDILEDARKATPGADPIIDKLGAFYGSCMDEAGIEQAGMTGIQPLLDSIAAVKDGKSLEAAIIALHDAGVGVVFNAGAEADFKDSTQNAMWLDSGGLGLPDRDYYSSKDFADKLDAYQQHLVRLFGLLGKTPAEAQAATADVLAIETALAGATRTNVERRDPAKSYNPTDVPALATQTPGFDWPAYFAGRGKAGIERTIVTTPEFFTKLGEMFGSVTPAAWQSYLTSHLVDDYAFALPKRFDDEAFALAKALTGVEVQRDRYKRCIDAVGQALPEALAQPYVAKMFPGASKDGAAAIVDAIAASFGDEVDTLDWMSAETKAKAHDKLTKIAKMIGYPDTWRVYDFAVSPTNFAANTLAGIRFETHRQFVKAGTPVDRDEWLMPPYIVNAYYNPLANNTALPAGILQPPFFGVDRSVAANAGGIGMVIGHELTHGFDDQGAQFDASGNMSMWWQQADYQSFTERGKCLADQYSTFEVLPGKFVNGQLTLGENIADLGGVKLGFHAYHRLRDGAKQQYVADGFTEDQQYFLGVGQAWCSKIRDDAQLSRLTTDPHSPARWRVNGALRNTPEFAQAFKCAEGSKMRPAQTCSIW
ncbi:MAG: M13 family metallopeptidase [Kofleriaceae bacterium]|nr:M13 family metallopeptidase [Myxococcales bacterium]MCB9563389.1 M13 family metallopeptidase [Kofleriaceae bacterium]MCB9573681.1 M13 family metallopeptidase [Kofleriaceae bacterium]